MGIREAFGGCALRESRGQGNGTTFPSSFGNPDTEGNSPVGQTRGPI